MSAFRLAVVVVVLTYLVHSHAMVMGRVVASNEVDAGGRYLSPSVQAEGKKGQASSATFGRATTTLTTATRCARLAHRLVPSRQPEHWNTLASQLYGR